MEDYGSANKTASIRETYLADAVLAQGGRLLGAAAATSRRRRGRRPVVHLGLLFDSGCGQRRSRDEFCALAADHGDRGARKIQKRRRKLLACAFGKLASSLR